jgi:hypothetical protein
VKPSGQGVAPLDAHFPEPSQTCPLTAAVPAHNVAPQDNPLAANVRHWPLPSHCPSAPHGFIGSGEHAFLGSLPATTESQIPSTPPLVLEPAQLTHEPEQAV